MADDQVKMDAIVVGGGPAGLAAAYTMAQAGLQVVLVERGEYAGSKNVGGLLYGTILNEMMPGFAEKAPIERSVAKRQIFFLGEGQHVAVSFGADAWSKPPYNYTYTVHRSQFDRWFAKQVEEAGASLVEGMVVDGLLYQGEGAAKQASGVLIRGGEQFLGDVIVLADGANCLVTEKTRGELGLRGGATKQHFALGVKEVIGLPKGVIEDRFGLSDGEGAAYDFIGVPFAGLIGGGFIYTQKETVCLGFAAKLETLAKGHQKPTEIMDAFKRHPVVANFLRGGELLEYSAHLIPEGGYDAVPQLAGNGVLIAGDAAGLVNMSLYKEGTNHAMESGRTAGEVAKLAKDKGDFSLATLGEYERRLQASVALADLKKYRALPEILDCTPEVLGLYPAKVTRLLVDYFTNAHESKAAIQKRAVREFFRDLPKLKFVRDLIRARKLM